ncbi:Ribosomal protein s6, partial [Globisporangium splendens]
MNLFQTKMATSADGHDADDSAARDGSRIYVGNLTPKANEVHLKKLFVKFGVILSIWVARKLLCLTLISLFCVYVRVMDAGYQPPGFAFVHFETREAAQRAVDAFEDAKESDHAMEILGKPVKVQMAGEKKKKMADSVQDQAVIADAREGCKIATIICMNAVESDPGAAQALTQYALVITDLDRYRRDARVEAAVPCESRDLAAVVLIEDGTTDKLKIGNGIDDSDPTHEVDEGERNELVPVAAAEVQLEIAVGIEDVGAELGAEAQVEVTSTPGAADEDGLRH